MILLASESILISTVIDDTFNYVIDLEHFGDWFPGVESIASIDDKPCDFIGKTYKEQVKMPVAGTLDVLIKVVNISPNKYIITEGNLTPLLPRMTITVESKQSGTHVAWQMESRNPSRFFQYTLLPFAKIVLTKRVKSGLIQLKSLLENKAS